ncbi:MAG: hypothetical protein V4539_24995 [Bacteroidota bacterium]
MHTDPTQFTQLAIDLEIIPIAFRGGFVLFLLMVMFLMKDEDKKKGIGRIND